MAANAQQKKNGATAQRINLAAERSRPPKHRFVARSANRPPPTERRYRRSCEKRSRSRDSTSISFGLQEKARPFPYRKPSGMSARAALQIFGEVCGATLICVESSSRLGNLKNHAPTVKPSEKSLHSTRPVRVVMHAVLSAVKSLMFCRAAV